MRTKPGCLGYTGGETIVMYICIYIYTYMDCKEATLPNYIWIVIRCNKPIKGSLLNSQYFMESIRVFFRGSLVQ